MLSAIRAERYIIVNILIIIICLYLAFNIVTSKMLTAKEMKTRFIDGQCIVGKIAANAFIVLRGYSKD